LAILPDALTPVACNSDSTPERTVRVLQTVLVSVFAPVFAFVPDNSVVVSAGITVCTNLAPVATASLDLQCAFEKPAPPEAVAAHVKAVWAEAPCTAIALTSSAQSAQRPMAALRPFILCSP
jgi:hypothetical protein